jgi:hypothetical protein
MSGSGLKTKNGAAGLWPGAAQSETKEQSKDYFLSF